MTGPAPRGRISTQRVRALRNRLSDRDRRVLDAVDDLRLLSARQIERAIFDEGSELTRARRARATLQRLTEAGCLTRLERRIGGVRAGSASYIYALAPLGQRLLHPGLDRLRRVREPGTSFVDHTLGVAEVWVRLGEANRRGRLQLRQFQAEPACWRQIPGAYHATSLKPDAYVALETNEWEQHSFVEVDLGTECQTVIRRKAQSYVDYWRTGNEQARFGVFPKVIFLVPDDRRRARIADTLAQLPAENWQLFQVAVLDDAIDALAPTDGDRGS